MLFIGNCGVKIKADPPGPRIIGLLNEDIRAEKIAEVVAIMVNPLIAVKLFLEGKIGREHILNADFDDNEVRFTKIPFETEAGEKILTIIVKGSSPWGYATVDEEGNSV